MNFELKAFYRETVESGVVTDRSRWEGFARSLWVLGMISKEELDEFIKEILNEGR